ncbi:MAG: pyrroline-5-carboxylate reductase [Microthrixaceae bacterium]|nr:pyrroline-5-carboxylate reductase [Microthrixaceae bacterium]
MTILQIVGGGKMGEALIGGILRGGDLAPGDVRVVEAVAERREALAELFPGAQISTEIGPASGTIIAVKPAGAAAVAAAVAAAGGGRILSIAAGVTLAQLEAAAGPGVAVVRAMPNTPALIGEGASAVAGGTHASDADVDWAVGLLGAVGVVVRVDESQLDAVTALSGSGPAYVFLIGEALIDAGVSAGLSRDLATTLAAQTLVGSAQLMAQSDLVPSELRAAVTSPGGTTAAGVRVLEQRAVRAALIDAVHAAFERSREMAH